MSTTPFSTLPLSPAILANLESIGYHEMTAIQAESLPHVLQGKDLLAQAKTGSGKTAAFALGLLSHLKAQNFAVQALVLCPTRELADQVGKEIRKLARFIPNIKVLSLCGGTPIGPQLASLEHGAHIVVGTPGRIMDHLGRHTLNLSRLSTLVLDEADRMLQMGFADDINAIIERTPSSRQTLLFSATFPEGIRSMSDLVQKKPICITVEAVHSNAIIEQQFYKVDKTQKLEALVALLSHYQPESTLIFANTKIACQEVADALKARGFHALAMHGDLDQYEREVTLTLFSNKSCSILVATDVAARGLDIKDLDAVVNLELPRDPHIYIHRVGRTGRAGKSGLALSLYTSTEISRVKAIEEASCGALTHGVADLATASSAKPPLPPMVTLCVSGGQKHKVRPGDILGALTSEGALASACIGKITSMPFYSFVAVQRQVADQALHLLSTRNIKGRAFKARRMATELSPM